MRYLTIEYGREFISNKIKDELLLNNIWDFTRIEKIIVEDIRSYFGFDIGISRNINTLSGGQRSIAYLLTLSHIADFKQIRQLTLNLLNIKESLSANSNARLITYLNDRGIYVAE